MTKQDIINEKYQAAIELRRPCVQFRPHLHDDCGKWIAVYGDDIASGVCGVGDSPELAMANFDKNWRNNRYVKNDDDIKSRLIAILKYPDEHISMDFLSMIEELNGYCIVRIT